MLVLHTTPRASAGEVRDRRRKLAATFLERGRAMLTASARLSRILRMQVRTIWTVCLALAPLSACLLANVGADKKVSDAVQSLNEQARWGRVNDAALLVQPDYRDAFIDRRRNWGNGVQLADIEVLNIQLASDSEHASATVSYSWYAMTDMTLHVTTLHQAWTSRKRGFALASETVTQGDPGLFSPPKAKVDKQSD
jgi:hypothetical protein